MRKLILAIVAVAVVAMPAFASVQNIKVKGSIDNTFLHRDNFDFGLATSQDREQNLFITQTTVGIDADLSDNVSATVGLINERAWNEPDQVSGSINDSNTSVNLYQAYVTLRQMLYSPLTVVVGRQAFHYGNSFIMDSAGTNNSAANDTGLQNVAEDLTKATSLDAFRAILDYNPLTLEFLFAKVDANTLASTNTDELNNDDIDLFGANATWEIGDAMKTQVEGYLFARINHNAQTGSTNDVHKSDTLYVPGLRASTNPVEGLNVQGEFAIQRGTKVEDSINSAEDVQNRDAYGFQFIANYQVPALQQYKPVAQYVYTYVSGDSNYVTGATESDGYSFQSSSEKFTAWDPFFENQASGKIYNSLYNLTNAHIHEASLQVSPIEDVTLKGSWTGIWSDKETRCGNTGGGTPQLCSVGSLVQPDGTTVSSLAINAGEDEVGNELDLEAVYNYTEDVQIGANVGMFLPGEIYQGINDSAAKQAIVHANVSF